MPYAGARLKFLVIRPSKRVRLEKRPLTIPACIRQTDSCRSGWRAVSQSGPFEAGLFSFKVSDFSAGPLRAGDGDSNAKPTNRGQVKLGGSILHQPALSEADSNACLPYALD